jgi:hypothetical protein
VSLGDAGPPPAGSCRRPTRHPGGAVKAKSAHLRIIYLSVSGFGQICHAAAPAAGRCAPSLDQHRKEILAELE